VSSASSSRADHLLSFEHAAHLDPERVLNRALAPVSWLSAAAGYYLTLHFAVTLAALALLYFRHPHLYAKARTSLVPASYTAGVACRRGEPPL
jgi:hypothetical protein